MLRENWIWYSKCFSVPFSFVKFMVAAPISLMSKNKIFHKHNPTTLNWFILYHTPAIKSRRKPYMESATCCGMEAAQRAGWNHGNAVYGIKPQGLYFIRASRNAVRDFVAIPYNARGALMPYPACGLDNKKGTFGRQKFLFCWRRGRDSNPN